MKPNVFHIKLIHSSLFFILSIGVVIVLYGGITGHINSLTWTAEAVVLVEGIILLMNDWKCPLTKLAEKRGAEKGSVADIFLPKWFSDHLFQICGGIFIAGTILVVIRRLNLF